MTRRVVAGVIVLGLTQWLIAVGIHTPGHKQPGLTQAVEHYTGAQEAAQPPQQSCKGEP